MTSGPLAVTHGPLWEGHQQRGAVHGCVGQEVKSLLSTQFGCEPKSALKFGLSPNFRNDILFPCKSLASKAHQTLTPHPLLRFRWDQRPPPQSSLSQQQGAGWAQLRCCMAAAWSRAGRWLTNCMKASSGFDLS
jgi:hypothetical protein